MSAVLPAPSLPRSPARDDDAFFRDALREAAAEAFERVARTVRRTVLLAQRLNEAPAAPSPADALRAGRRAVIRAAEDAITGEKDLLPEARTRLEAEFRERLDAPELAEDLAARPVAEVIRDVLRDLDLGRQPWVRLRHRRRTPAAVRTLHALAAGHSPPPPGASEPPGPVPAPDIPLERLHALLLSRARPADDGSGRGALASGGRGAAPDPARDSSLDP